jgi:hypothetical protein
LPGDVFGDSLEPREARGCSDRCQRISPAIR